MSEQQTEEKKVHLTVVSDSDSLNTAPFRNEYLSTSRLKKYEECPLSFKYRYIDLLNISDKDLRENPAQFGNVLHVTLESLYSWVIREEFCGYLKFDMVHPFYRESWREHKLVGLDLYNEGLDVLRKYIEKFSYVDHMKILGTEIEFEFKLDEFTITGSIDRVDRVSEDTIRIIDYKSNRILFSQEEINSDLQSSVYAMAAVRKWPWVKNLEFEFHMLRHAETQNAKRTVDHIRAAEGYVVAMGRRTENDPAYPGYVNPNCQYCDYLSVCPVAAKAIAENRAELQDLRTFGDVLRQRQQVAALSRLFYKRQNELDAVIRNRLDSAPGGRIEVEGHVAALQHWSKGKRYDTPRIVKLVSRTLGMSLEEAYYQLATVDEDRVETLLSMVKGTISKAKADLLRIEIDVLTEKIPGQPRLQVQAKKGVKDPGVASLPTLANVENEQLTEQLQASLKAPKARKPRATKSSSDAPKPRAAKKNKVAEVVELD